VLARRQRGRFGPFVQAGVSFGAVAVSAFYSLMMAGFAALLAVEIIPSDPTSTPSPEEQCRLDRMGGLDRSPAAPRAPAAAGTAVDRGEPCSRLSRPAGPGSP
jgi:hypothetical protein